MKKTEAIKWLKELAFISREAGNQILEVYNSDFAIEKKEDRSPLTLADQKAHEVIQKALSEFDFPILSEEGKEIPYEERKTWKRFWMVDPLDGTKEFIKRNGEFTVNIALIEEQKTVLGAIYVPVKDVLYLGANEVGAFKVSNLKEKDISDFDQLLKEDNRLPQNGDRPFTIVGSRSHMSEETREFMEELEKQHDKVEVMAVGSSLKLCMIAEGKADVYPRFAPTMEWDTAAGQAIVEAVGGKVLDWQSRHPMRYNREVLRNNWFLASV